jgi:four helix bundle protein
MRNFRELEIWKNSMKIVVLVFELKNHFPKEELYGLWSQISRSAVSIPSNIAEGSAKTSDKDFKRYLQIALGSSYELETQIEIAQQVNILTKDQTTKILKDLTIIQKQTNAFITSLNKYIN